MSIKSLRKIIRSARKGLCQSCSRTEYPQLEAAGAGHIGCLIYTIETQGLRVRDQNNVSAVHVAARKNQVEVLVYLVENDLISDLFRARNGATPAHDAAGTGSLDCLRYLLIHTACTAHDKDYSGQTPLHWAAMFGHLRIVIWLVNDSNATINSVNKQGLTPIHLAAQKNHLDVLQWLIKITYKNHPNPLEVVNQRSGQGCTPLFLAASEGHIQIVRWLAEKAGGDPTIFSYAGVAPLHAATALGHSECLKYLFQFGLASSPGGLRTRDGSSAIHMAARCGNVEVVKWLLSQKEISGSEKDHTHYTPSHEAAEQGHFRILKFLYDQGINVDVVDINGYTPFDLAIRGKHKQCEAFLKAVCQPQMNGKVRRPVVRRESTGNSHLDNYGMDPLDDVTTQLTLDMEQTLTHSTSEEFPTLRDMMDEEEIKHIRPSSTEGNLEQLKKEHEAQRKRKDMAVKLQQEQQHRNLILAKKKEEQKKAQEKIRERFLKDSPVIPEMDEVEEYIAKTDQSIEKRRPSLVEERKSAFEVDVEEEVKTPKKKGFLSRLRKSVSPSPSVFKQPNKDVPHERHVIVVEEKLEMSGTRTTPHKKPHVPKETKPPTSKEMKHRTSKEMKHRTSKESNNPESKESSQGVLLESEGSSTSLISSRSGNSSRSGKKPKRRQYVEGGKWIESGEAVRAGMKWTYSDLSDSPSGKRRRPRVRKLTPAPQPIRSRLAEQNVTIPKLNLDDVGKPSKSGTKQSNKGVSPKALSSALTASSKQPKYTRQSSQDDSSPPPSPTLADIEDELSKMENTTLALQRPPMALGRVLIPKQTSEYDEEEEELSDLSNEEETESEETEEESSGEDSGSTASSDSSKQQRLKMRHPPRPVVGLKAGLMRGGLLGSRPGSGAGGSPRKMLSGGYSRLQRRRVIRLSTIHEDPVEEERLDVQKEMYLSVEERAVIHHREVLLQKAYEAWQKYMFMMKAAKSKAAVMARQKKRALLSRFFNAWLNYTIVERFNAVSQEVEEILEEVKPVFKSIENTSSTKQSGLEQVEFKSLSAIKNRFPTGGRELSHTPKQVKVTPTSVVEKEDPFNRKKEKEGAPQPILESPKPKTAQDRGNPISAPQQQVSQSQPEPKSYQRKTSFRMTHNEKSQMYLEWLNDHLIPLGLSANNLTTDISSAVPVLTVLTNLSGRKMPQYHRNPKLLPQLMNNWKLVRDEMEYLGMKTMGIEPEDLSKQDEAVIHLMFNVILKWYNSTSR